MSVIALQITLKMKNKPYDELIEKLEYDLTQLKTQTQDIIMLIEKAIGICEHVILNLRGMVANNSFSTQEEEVYFFKHIKPQVFSKLIFYIKLFEIEAHRINGNKRPEIKYLKKVLQELHRYFEENIELCQYYWRKQTYLDHLYFVRGKTNHRIHPDNITNLVDPQFSTGYDQTLANIMAHETLIKYVGNEIEKIKNNLEDNQTGGDINTFHSGAEWTGPTVALVELIYALHSAKVINDGKLEIKEIAEMFEKMFNVKLGDYYRIFIDIRSRKIHHTRFLDSMIEALMKRMDKLDL